MAFWQSTEFKVGSLVIGVGTLIAVMSMQISDDPRFLSKSSEYWFILPNAGGLIKKSSVKSAGIPIGIIHDISLQDGRARVDISIKSSVPLYSSATVEVRAQGILGDSHVEINPGSPTDPPLPQGSQILNIKDGGSLDKLVSSVTEVTDNLKGVAISLKEAVSDDGTRKHVLGRIVTNIEKLTQDLSQITSENKDKIGEIVDQVHGVSSTLNDLINDKSEDGFKHQWKKAMVAMGRLDNTMKNIEEISNKINKGEGTIGKLVNDETTVEELNTAIQGVSGMIDTASKIQTGFDFHSEYLNSVGSAKSYIGINIQPGLDRYYYLAIVDDPAGVVKTTQVKTTNADGTLRDQTVEERTYKNETKFTALFAKNFYDLTVKGGLIENTGGFGVDYNFFRRKFKFSLDFYNFSHLNVRTAIQYKLFSGFYAIGGMSDMLDKNSARSAFIGAGLFLTNDDLKLLLTKSPF